MIQKIFEDCKSRGGFFALPSGGGRFGWNGGWRLRSGGLSFCFDICCCGCSLLESNGHCLFLSLLPFLLLLPPPPLPLPPHGCNHYQLNPCMVSFTLTLH